MGDKGWPGRCRRQGLQEESATWTRSGSSRLGGTCSGSRGRKGVQERDQGADAAQRARVGSRGAACAITSHGAKEPASPFPAARVCACVPEHMARTSPPSRLPRLPLSSWRRQGIGGLEGRAPVHSIGEHRPTGPPPPTTHPSTKRRRAGHARSNPYRPEPSLRCPEDVRRWSLLCPTFVLSSRLAFAIGPFPHPR